MRNLGQISPRRKTLIRRIFVVVSIALTGGAVFLAVLLGVSWYKLARVRSSKPAYRLFTDPPNATIRLVINNMGGRAVVQRTNRWGMLGEQPPVDWKNYRTLIAVGGSTTHCLVLGYGRDWPHRLQSLLRKRHRQTWVGNAGIVGHSTEQHIALMEEFVTRVRPDVTLFLIGWNDLSRAFNWESWKNIRPLDHHPEKTFTYWRLFFRSRLVQLWLNIKQFVSRRTKSGSYVRYVMVPSTWQVASLPPHARLVPDAEFDAEISAYFPRFRENIRRLAKLARDNGIQPVFATQPCLFAETPHWSGIIGHRGIRQGKLFYLSGAQVARQLKRVNAVLLNVCREERLSCVDLFPVVPHDQEHFFDSMHLSGKGATRVAQALAKHLLTLPLFKGRRAE